jgi:hypothetical protein
VYYALAANMAYDERHDGFSDLSDFTASGLPEIVWNFEATSETFKKSVLMYRTFQSWKMASKYGFKLHDVLYCGVQLTPREISVFNIWIQSGAAEAASKLVHWDAVRLFERIKASSSEAGAVSA